MTCARKGSHPAVELSPAARTVHCRLDLNALPVLCGLNLSALAAGHSLARNGTHPLDVSGAALVVTETRPLGVLAPLLRAGPTARDVPLALDKDHGVEAGHGPWVPVSLSSHPSSEPPVTETLVIKSC